MKLRQLLFALLIPFLGHSQTVVDVIVNSPDHETLEAAVIAADLVGTLSGDGPFTVFAPTDDAFAALPAGTVEALLEDPAGDLTQVLLYHVLSGQVESGDLSDGLMATTINGADIAVGIAGGVVTINGATVTTANVPATNGVVHVIDAVLLPPAPQTILDVVVNSPMHTTLQVAVEAAGLGGALSGAGPLTLFAPTDDAFAALPAGTVEALLEDPSGALTDVLLYHVVEGAVQAADLVEDDLVQTLNKKGVEISIASDGSVFINDAMVTMTDIVTPNGIVHVLDAVLVPNFSIMDIIEDSEVHNTLEAAIDAAQLTTILHSDDIEITVFAPTDDAFAALPAGTVDALLADPQGALFDVLFYHLTGGTGLEADLSDGLVITTGFGKQATVTFQDDKIFIDNAEIVMTDLEADNGVVHVIDAVLIPPTTVVDRVNESADHTILASLLSISGLDITLNGNADLTLFAPNDEAITALGQANIELLLSNPDLLETILRYHVVPAASIESSEITDGLIGLTGTGLDIILNLENGAVTINQGAATVDAPDISADNGIVHSITGVLLPATTAGTVANSPAFSTLATALTESELLPVFADVNSRLTVFAPTNDAFDALPDGVLETLLADPTGELATILTTHVVDGRVFAGDLSDGMVVSTLSGEDVTVTIDANGVFINNAQVIQADVFTGNGLIHVIDAVIQDELGTVVDVIVNSPVHETLEAAVIAADLAGTLSGEGPFTVFAPTDEAFAALPDGLLETLLEMPAGDLTTILTYHVVGASVESSSLSDGDTAPTLQGESVNVTINTDGVFINDAQVVMADIPASNGIVHVIDGVLLPGAITSTTTLPSAAVTVAPTVTTDLVTVSYDGDELGSAAVYIFDNAGKLVMTMQNMHSGSSVDLSELAQGAYYMTISDGQRATTKKVTKM